MLLLLPALFCWTVSFASASTLALKAGQDLDSVLSHYETIRMESVDESVLFGQESASRDGEFPVVHLRISALNRTFSLHLYRGESAFTPDAKIVVHGAAPGEPRREMDARDLATNYVEGFLLGEHRRRTTSSVRGHVQDGAFNGVVVAGDESYYVEPAATYFDNASRFDAIVYEERAAARGGSEGNRTRPKPFCYGDLKHGDTTSDVSYRYPSVSGGPPRSAAEDPVPLVDGQPARVGRACKAKVVADHHFYTAYGGGSLKRTIAEMEFHVREADEMFSRTDFDGDGKPDRVRIRLATAEVFQRADAPDYLLRDDSLNASAYLELFSSYDHDGFCAAMVFSQRPFVNEILGFAYRGSPDTTGGICTRRLVVGGKTRSLNVGMTTFNHKGTAIPKARSTVVFTHELGHMFGSRHDEDVEGSRCFHEDQNQHYIMSSIANFGLTPTNRRFSPCSIRLMRINMDARGACLRCVGLECGRGGPRVAAAPLVIVAALVSAMMLAC